MTGLLRVESNPGGWVIPLAGLFAGDARILARQPAFRHAWAVEPFNRDPEDIPESRLKPTFLRNV